MVAPVLLVLVSACSDAPVPEVDKEQPTRLVQVEVQELRPKTWQGMISTFGVVEALEEVNVAAELSGTVKAVHINEGDSAYGVLGENSYITPMVMSMAWGVVFGGLVSLVLLPVMYMVEQDIRAKLASATGGA